MPISHLCARCGLDLARTRPRRDPALGLPILRCPRCQTPAVRRRHPLLTDWRRAGRARRGLWLFLGQVTTVGVLLWTLGGLSRFMAGRAADAGVTALAWITGAFRIQAGFAPETEHPFVVSVWLLAALIGGVWLGATLPHWPRWTPPIVWIGALTLGVGADAATWVLWTPIARAAGRFDPYWGPTVGEWWDAARVALAAGLLGFGVYPAGWGVHAATGWQRRRRWRARRARMRRERQGR